MKETNREYAEALFQLAAENNCIENYSNALSSVRLAVEENPDYPVFLDSPSIPLSERLAAIDAAFSASMPEYVVSFLKLLVENGRIQELLSCIDEFENLRRFAQNTVTAIVYSVVELTDQQKEKLCNKLSATTGKSVTAKFSVDPSLIGGIKIEIDGKTLDGSIENHLKRIKGVIS